MGGMEELRAQLRSALLAASDTATIRQAIADAEAAEARAAREAAQCDTERVAAEEARLRQSANILAAAAAERIASSIAALEPPPAPAPAAQAGR